MIFSHKKGMKYCYNMVESGKHAKWKKPGTKGHILHKTTDNKHPK